MKLADLVFIAAALLTLFVLGRLAYNALRRRWELVRRIGIRWIGFMTVYLVVIVGVSLAPPRQ